MRPKLMPYHKRYLNKDKKKDWTEPFSAREVGSSSSLYYYFPKIIGLTYQCNAFPSMKRSAVVKTFFLEVGDSLGFLHNEIKLADFKRRSTEVGFIPGNYSIEDYVRLVEENDNPFDPNAISVRVKWTNSEFLDIGYLPASHSAILRTIFPGRTVVGVEKDGLGMRLHIILSKEPIPIYNKPVEKKSEEVVLTPKFLSLRKMRKVLEVRK